MGVYVDDHPIASNFLDAFKKVITQLQAMFPMKVFPGTLEFSLGIKVTHNRIEGTLMLSSRQ